jgi:hypothetical protein
MNNLNDTLSDIASSIKKRKAERAAAKAAALPQDTLKWAVIILKADAAFSNDETMQIIDMFMADQEVARVYASLQLSRMRTNLVVHNLAKMRGESV